MERKFTEQEQIRREKLENFYKEGYELRED
jgi:hypothetical protein